MSVLDAQEPAWAEDDWPALVLGLYALCRRVERVLDQAPVDPAPPDEPELVDFLLGAAHLSGRIRDLVDAACLAPAHGPPGAGTPAPPPETDPFEDLLR